MIETLEDAEDTECCVDGTGHDESIWYIHEVVGSANDHNISVLV